MVRACSGAGSRWSWTSDPPPAVSNGLFKDHFRPVAQQYASYRPTYPFALFEWLAAQAPARDLAWDCATGSGQAALDLSRCFTRVVATDASAAQIAQAALHERIAYRVAAAEDSGLEAHSVDLVVVAQALHWFDVDRFNLEARRVLQPHGVVAAWCYGLTTIDGNAIDDVIQGFYSEIVGPYWPPERRHIETGYRDLPFPFAVLDTPAFSMHVEWSLVQLLGYLRTWSATARFVEARGRDPVTDLERHLEPMWGSPGEARRVSWPLALRVGKVT